MPCRRLTEFSPPLQLPPVVLLMMDVVCWVRWAEALLEVGSNWGWHVCLFLNWTGTLLDVSWNDRKNKCPNEHQGDKGKGKGKSVKKSHSSLTEERPGFELVSTCSMVEQVFLSSRERNREDFLPPLGDLVNPSQSYHFSDTDSILKESQLIFCASLLLLYSFIMVISAMRDLKGEEDEVLQVISEARWFHDAGGDSLSSRFRPLDTSEVERLKARGNEATDWSEIFVKKVGSSPQYNSGYLSKPSPGDGSRYCMAFCNIQGIQTSGWVDRIIRCSFQGRNLLGGAFEGDLQVPYNPRVHVMIPDSTTPGGKKVVSFSF